MGLYLHISSIKSFVLPIDRCDDGQNVVLFSERKCILTMCISQFGEFIISFKDNNNDFIKS